MIASAFRPRQGTQGARTEGSAWWAGRDGATKQARVTAGAAFRQGGGKILPPAGCCPTLGQRLARSGLTAPRGGAPIRPVPPLRGGGRGRARRAGGVSPIDRGAGASACERPPCRKGRAASRVTAERSSNTKAPAAPCLSNRHDINAMKLPVPLPAEPDFPRHEVRASETAPPPPPTPDGIVGNPVWG